MTYTRQLPHNIIFSASPESRELIDLSRRNSLLYYRPLKTGTLELSSAPPEKLRELITGDTLSAGQLLADIEDETVLPKLLRDISRRALENLEEEGLSTLFVTFGMATWPATDGGRAAKAPSSITAGGTKQEGR